MYVHALSGGQYEFQGACTSCPVECLDDNGEGYCGEFEIPRTVSEYDISVYKDVFVLNHFTDTSGSCQARCGVYVEGRGPVPVLSGVGLSVQDADDDRDFPMEVGETHELPLQL